MRRRFEAIFFHALAKRSYRAAGIVVTSFVDRGDAAIDLTLQPARFVQPAQFE